MKLKTLICKLVLISAFVVTAPGAAPAEDRNLDIKGSSTVLPVAQKAAEAYMDEHPDVEISVSGGGSGNGIKAVIDGTTDIGNSSRFIKQEEVKRAVENGAYPVPFSVAVDCIVPVVHPDNPVEDLDMETLKKIYRGRIKNWSEVGGDDRGINVITRDSSSGTYETWREMVLEGDRIFPGASTMSSNGAIAQAVSKNRNSIGYIGLSYVNDSLKALKVNGVEAGVDTAASYPLSRPLFMFTRGWPEGLTMKFINYLLHPEKGQKLVEETGYLPRY